MNDLYCLTCSCHESCCDCGAEQQLIEAHYCDSCGSICSEDDLDANGECYECQ